MFAGQQRIEQREPRHARRVAVPERDHGRASNRALNSPVPAPAKRPTAQAKAWRAMWRWLRRASTSFAARASRAARGRRVPARAAARAPHLRRVSAAARRFPGRAFAARRRLRRLRAGGATDPPAGRGSGAATRPPRGCGTASRGGPAPAGHWRCRKAMDAACEQEDQRAQLDIEQLDRIGRARGTGLGVQHGFLSGTLAGGRWLGAEGRSAHRAARGGRPILDENYSHLQRAS